MTGQIRDPCAVGVPTSLDLSDLSPGQPNLDLTREDSKGIARITHLLPPISKDRVDAQVPLRAANRARR